MKTLVIIPSRGRPKQLLACLTALETRSSPDVTTVVALDDDDPEFEAYGQVLGGHPAVLCFQGMRRSLTSWTNKLAFEVGLANGYEALVSMGDDHLPRTDGWDTVLADAIRDMGGTGIAYPDDMRRTDIPEAVMVSGDIVRALGWFCLPSLRHFYVDNVWADLGNGAGCLRFCPASVVEHMHWERGFSDHDLTYLEAESRMELDRAAYEAWCLGGRDSNVTQVRRLARRDVRT